MYGLVGLCIGVVAGRLVQTVVYPVMAARSLARPDEPSKGSWWALLRPTIAMSGLFAIAAFLGERNVAPGWPLWGLGVVLTTGIALALAYTLGLPPDIRRMTAGRMRAVLGGSRA